MKNLFHVAVVAAAMAMVCSSAYAQEKKTLQIDGSTTVGPIADAFAEQFKKDHADIAITVNKTGSGNGIAALIDGRCQIADASRFMSAEEFKKAAGKGISPCCHTVALDGVCVIVHPSNPAKALTIAQARDIYMGKITNWKDVGGADKPIVVISRDTSSGTYECFNEKVMGKGADGKANKMGDKVEYVNANPQAHSRVATTEGAVSYVGLGFVDKEVKALEINGIASSKKTVQNGTYPLARPLFMFTNGFPEMGTPAYLFCTFYLTEKGQEIIVAKGFVPVTNY